MSGAFGNYEDRPSYPHGSNYTDSHITGYDVVEKVLNHRHNAPSTTTRTHSSRSATPGSTHNSYECTCRDRPWTHSPGYRELDQRALRDIIRRNHRKVDRVNRTISACTVWSQVHPKVKYDGTYPREFNLPKTVNEFKAIDISVLDRILASYNLADSGSSIAEWGNRGDVRVRKLWRLFEFLGADGLTKRGEDDPYYGKSERYY